jgi:hypothetical protein
MAKKKKKPAHRSRRRMSGINSKGIMHDLMEAGGFVLGQIGGAMIQRQVATNPKIIAGVELVAGHMVRRHAKGPLMSGIGWGVFGAGAMGLAQGFHVISGIENMMSGLDNESQGYIEEGTSGFNNETTLHGFPNETSLHGLGQMSFM